MDRSGMEFRLVLTLGVIALVAIVGLLAILPYRLYERDIQLASEHAHRMSSVIQAALHCPLGAGDATDLIERVKAGGEVDIALARVEAGAMRTGVLAGRGSSVLDDTDLYYVSAPVAGEGGEPYVAQLHFDLSPMKHASLRLVIDLLVAVAVGAFVFSVVIFVLFRNAFVRPLRELTRRVERMAAGETDVAFPHAENRELRDLAGALERLRPGRGA